MQKKYFYPFDSLRASSIAQRAAKCNLTYLCGRFAPSGFALAFSVSWSVHVKFHHDRIKTKGARGIHTYIDRCIDRPWPSPFHKINNNETVSRNQERDDGDFKEMNIVETVFKPSKNFKAKACSVTSGNTALSMKDFNQICWESRHHYIPWVS